MMRKMLVEFLENRKESPEVVESMDVFMKVEAFKVMDEMWSNKKKSRLDTLVHGDFWAANILFSHDRQGYLHRISEQCLAQTKNVYIEFVLLLPAQFRYPL